MGPEQHDSEEESGFDSAQGVISLIADHNGVLLYVRVETTVIMSSSLLLGLQ